MMKKLKGMTSYSSIEQILGDSENYKKQIRLMGWILSDSAVSDLELLATFFYDDKGYPKNLKVVECELSDVFGYAEECTDLKEKRCLLTNLEVATNYLLKFLKDEGRAGKIMIDECPLPRMIDEAGMDLLQSIEQ